MAGNTDENLLINKR